MITQSGFSAFAEVKEERLNYVLLGDSIARGAGVLNPDEACYGLMVANTNGYNFTNYAVNGYRTENLIKHLQKENVAEAVKQADIISISIGGNDFLTNNIAGLIFDATVKKDISRFDEIAAQLRINFATIIETIKELNPDALILTQTLYNPRNDFIHDSYQLGADRINACIMDYLRENPGAYDIVDVASAFGNDESYIAADKIHPSAKGNVKIAELVLKKLHDLGYSGKTEPVVVTEGIDQIPSSFSFKNIIAGLKNAVQSFITFVKKTFENLAIAIEK